MKVAFGRPSTAEQSATAKPSRALIRHERHDNSNIELWEIRRALSGQLVVLLRKFEIAVSFWRRWSGMTPATVQKMKSVKGGERLSHSLSSNVGLLQIGFSVERRCGPCGDLAAVGRLGFEIEQ